MKTQQETSPPTGAPPRLADAIPRQSDTQSAWFTFEAALADALGLLEEDEYLIVGSKHRHHYVQFACHGHHGMWMEAVSNAYIAHPDERLSDAQNGHLATLGWDDPGSADRNWSLDVAAPVPAALVARLACRTLYEVYDISHPGALEYTAFRSQGDSIRFPTLRLRRRDPAPPSMLAGPIPAMVM
jgi:hypothetical protein